jgi:hypothetical protein
MHKEILTDAQVRLLPLLKKCAKNFGLVGGTAFALHLGHRRSIDFDLFTRAPFNNATLKRIVSTFSSIEKALVNKKGEYTLIAGGVKLTFFQFPFLVEYADSFNGIIHMPDLLTLSAMKAYALGQRAKWKDYVDLYFVMKDTYPITEVAQRAHAVFGNDFNEKLFRSQLAYFNDINYSEAIDYMPGHAVADEVVKRTLEELSVQ